MIFSPDESKLRECLWRLAAASAGRTTGRCAVCSSDSRRIHRHHILAKVDCGGEHRVNRVTLCEKCHRMVHNMLRRYWRGPCEEHWQLDTDGLFAAITTFVESSVWGELQGSSVAIMRDIVFLGILAPSFAPVMDGLAGAPKSAAMYMLSGCGTWHGHGGKGLKCLRCGGKVGDSGNRCSRCRSTSWNVPPILDDTVRISRLSERANGKRRAG